VAREVRSYLRTWIGEAERTVLLATHYMAEANELYDRIAIIIDGTIVMVDTAAAIKESAGFHHRYRAATQRSRGTQPGTAAT